MMDPINRRRFFQLSAAGAISGAWGCLHSPTEAPGDGNPRLTARPGTPSVTPEIGESVLGLGGLSDGILYVPDSYDEASAWPLLVALHGATGRANNWRELFDTCDELGIVLLAIDSQSRTWDRVGGFFGPDVQFIDRALVHTFDRINVDTNRMCLMGFSDGASYALSLGPNNGDLFSHLIAFSPGHTAPTADLIGTPEVFVSHGTQDGILFASVTRDQIVPQLRTAGYDVTYVEFEGGHVLPGTIAEQAWSWYLD
ncbi:MAG: hypothetical protein AAF389_04025 [Gemmatimonadota bacterium]